MFPQEAQHLLDLVRLRIFAASLGIEYLAYQDEQLSMRFADTSESTTTFRNSFLKKHRKKIASASNDGFVLDLPKVPEEKLIPLIRDLLTI